MVRVNPLKQRALRPPPWNYNKFKSNLDHTSVSWRSAILPGKGHSIDLYLAHALRCSPRKPEVLDPTWHAAPSQYYQLEIVRHAGSDFPSVWRVENAITVPEACAWFR